MTTAYYTILNDRAGVRIAGDDVRGFLQGLLTQDMKLLDGQNVTYSALLTPQGKIDFDFFVWKQGDDVVLECDAGRVEALRERLNMFKLRRNISLNIIQFQVLVVWGDDDILKTFPYERDPRHSALGLRKFIVQGTDNNDFNDLQLSDFKFYHKLLIANNVPNGPRDIAIGEDTVFDVGLDKLNAVSFTKGCYMGQELTSRMHHRGLSKKGLYSVTLKGEPLPPFTDIVTPEGNLIGEMRSSVDGAGLAVLRHDSLKAAARMGIVTPEAFADENAA